MNSVQIYELEQEIPLYIFYEDGSVENNKNTKQASEDDISDDIPDWVKNNHRRGK